MQLPSIISVKLLIIVLTLLVAGFLGYVYFKANGQNLAWCASNINACRISRIQALERDYSVINPSK